MRADRRVALLAVAGAAALLALPAARADVWLVAPSIGTEVLASDNIDQAAGAAARADTRLTVSPQLQVYGRGARYRLDANLAGDGFFHAQRTQAQRFLPRSRVDGSVVALDRWLYLDGSLAADTVAESVLDATLQGSASNRTRVYRERISPYLDHQFDPSTSLLARADRTWIQTRGSTAAGTTPVAGSLTGSYHSTVQSDLVRLDRRPTPLGLRLEGSRVLSSIQDRGLADVEFSVARASLLWGPDPQWFVGLTAGRDRARYSGLQTGGTLRGALLHWAPTERTTLDALLERRFFGNSYQLKFTHRSPFVVVASTLSREASTVAAQLASQSGASSLESLLDSAYRTRITDPVERLTRVRSDLANQGLSAGLSGASVVNAGSAQVVQGADLTVLLLGQRHTATARIYRQSTRALVGPDDTTTPSSADTRQTGLSLEVARRLDAQTTGQVEFTLSRNETLGLDEGVARVNGGLRVGLAYRFSPATVGAVGLRYQVSTSSVESVADVREVSVYAGANHRF